MRVALLVPPLVLVHWLSQAQSYQAYRLSSLHCEPVPLIVEKAFQRVFPAALVDSCDSYQSDMGKDANDEYTFYFKVKERPKEARFDGAGKLLSFITEVALDTLPRRVRQGFNEYYKNKQEHIGGAYQKYELKQGYAEVDLENKTISYTFNFNVIARGGRAFEWSIEIDKKGRQPAPKFR